MNICSEEYALHSQLYEIDKTTSTKYGTTQAFLSQVVLSENM